MAYSPNHAHRAYEQHDAAVASAAEPWYWKKMRSENTDGSLAVRTSPTTRDKFENLKSMTAVQAIASV